MNMSAMTIAEKVIARAAGRDRVVPGEVLFVEPDLVVLYDWVGLSDWFFDVLETELKLDKLPHPEKLLFFIDHLVPVQNETHWHLHGRTRSWCEKYGVKYIEGEGIGHSVLVQDGLVKPGMLVAHFDTHVSAVGAIGALGFGIMKELLMPMVTGKMWLRVPETSRIRLEGGFRKGVMGRDLLHKIVQDLGPDGCIDKVVEFCGAGAENVPVDARITLCGLTNFFGATTSLFAPDRVTREYLFQNEGVDEAAFLAEPDAPIGESRHYDLDTLEPTVISPPTISHAVPLQEVAGRDVHVGIIGTCASGRMEDLKIAAQVLSERKVKETFKLYVIPSSKRVFIEANREGYINALLEAGAFVSSPTCDFCYGKAVRLMPGERAISTQTLNVPGRLGSPEADIYLASSAVVAASAIEGVIADPRQYL